MSNSWKKWWCEHLGFFCQTHLVTVCNDTGQAARPWCPSQATRRYYVWVNPPPCELHKTDPGQVVEVEICRVTGLLPGPFCKKIMGTFKPGEEPTTTCQVCRKAYPDPNPKPEGMPKLGLANLSLHVLANRYTDAQLDAFAEKMSLAGVDFVRLMASWDEQSYSPISPFFRTSSGRFDLDQEDPRFDASLARIARIFKPYHLGIMFDFFDNCGDQYSPWSNNVDGINGTYDYSPAAIARFKRWIDRTIGDLGSNLPSPDSTAENLYGLGNELQHPSEGGGQDFDDWSRQWVLVLGEYLWDKGIRPVTFSGSPKTGHRMHGVLSPDLSTKFGMLDGCLILHWIGLPEDFTDPSPSYPEGLRQSISGQRRYAISDDGVGINPVLPPEKRGRCTTGGGACTANTEWRIKAAKAVTDWGGSRIHHIEYLPREISDGEPLEGIDPTSLSIYYELAMALWGFDVRRKYQDPGTGR